MQIPPDPRLRPPVIHASAAILVDAVSGQVLFEQNADTPRPPASTTKIMTALLLLEHTRPDEIITASKLASNTGGSSLNLAAGEKINAHDLLYALLLRSANDGCVAAAEHIAGSVPKFVELMNQKAREIGATSTVFRNPHGLNEPANVTTARDLALMARYASRHPEFCDATRTKFYTVVRTVNKKDSRLRNHAKFLWKFPGADGVKTGYTAPAGKCFVGAATWSGWRLIAVVLNSPDIYGETGQLLKYGFQQYQPLPVAARGQTFAHIPVRQGQRATVDAAAQDALQWIVPKGSQPTVEVKSRFDTVNAPVASGAPVGMLEAWADGHVVASTPLVATSAVPRAALAQMGGFIGGWYVAAALGMVVLGYAAAFTKNPIARRYRLKALLRSDHRRG